MNQNEFYSALFTQTKLLAEITTMQRIALDLETAVIDKQKELDDVSNAINQYKSKEDL